jgi:hypothetical protein
LKNGAKVVTGGKRAARYGTFFEPTVPTDLRPSRAGRDHNPKFQVPRENAIRVFTT